MPLKVKLTTSNKLNGNLMESSSASRDWSKQAKLNILFMQSWPQSGATSPSLTQEKIKSIKSVIQSRQVLMCPRLLLKLVMLAPSSSQVSTFFGLSLSSSFNLAHWIISQIKETQIQLKTFHDLKLSEAKLIFCMKSSRIIHRRPIKNQSKTFKKISCDEQFLIIFNN